jgi:hypothetical protein
MVEPLRHRQTKEAATDMFYLKPPRHISTLPKPQVSPLARHVRSTLNSRPPRHVRLVPKGDITAFRSIVSWSSLNWGIAKMT